jgi:aminoglycoside phosphotransferase (APT) family kinase protein
LIPSEQALANGFGPAVLSESVAELASGAWELLDCRLAAVRKQRRKRIVTYDVRWKDGDTVEDVEVVVKLYGSDRGAHALASLEALWEAGFRPPAPHRVPRPYGYSAGRGALVQGQATGTPWADYLGGADEALGAASEHAADWLVELERAPVRGPVRDPDEPAREVRRFAAELTALFPPEAERLDNLAETVCARLGEGPRSPVPAHGDYHPKNVFLLDDRTTVIDFDTFGLREPGSDAGYAIGQLLVMSRFRLGSFAPGALAAAAFWRRYSERGYASWRGTATHVGRTLLQSLHFELCTLGNGRTELLPLWPAVAQRLLDSDGPQALENPLRLG